jgi:replicative DNA helicase
VSAERIEADLCAQLVRYGGSESLLERVRPDHFASPQLASVAATAIDMLRSGAEVTSESLVAELLKRGRKGGAEALRFLDRHSLPREWDPMRGALELAEAARRRRMADVGRRLVRAGEAGDEDEWRAILQAAIDAQVDASEGDRYRIADGHGLLADLMEMAEARLRQPPMRVGHELDPVARELMPGQMVTIGGQTGAGKSTLALHFASEWHAATGAPAGVVSLEDRWGTWGDRWQARTTGTSILSAGREYLREAIDQVTHRAGELSASSIRIAEMVDSQADAVTDAMSALVRDGCSMVVVDYVQEITVRGADRRAEVSTAARACKAAAKRLRVPLVLCSQLARGQGGEPTSRSLKESGDLENISEAIVLLWRQSDKPGAHTHGKTSKLKNGLPTDRARFDLARGEGEDRGRIVLAPCSADADEGKPASRRDWVDP